MSLGVLVLPTETEFPGTSRFQVIRRLGSGAMGVVYHAVDRERRVPVALKTVRTLNADAILRFKQEFRALQDIHHANLIHLGELFEEEGQWFFTMELVEGMDFLSYVRADPEPKIAGAPTSDSASDGAGPTASESTFDETRLREAFLQLAVGVGALHAAGKIHRDIKPSNIRVTPEGRVVLLDFGLVTDTEESSLISELRVVGTTAYMAPEQAAALPLTPAADWYSIGVVMYQALTGRLPFTGTARELLVAKQRPDPPSPRAWLPSLPPDLDELCRGLLSPEAHARLAGPAVVHALGGQEPLARTTTSSISDSSLFVGRTAELAQLKAAWAETRRGRARALVVTGESGVGKSALLTHFAESISPETPRPLVLRGRCFERETVPYKAFDSVIDALTRHLRRIDAVDAALIVGNEAALAARVFPVLCRVPAVRQAMLPADLPNAQELRDRAFLALRRLFQRLAERFPLVVCIDDFQWADADSLTLCGALLSGPDAPTFLALFTVRMGTEARPAPLERELAKALGDVTTLPLSGLPPEDAQALARAMCQRSGSALHLDEAALAKEAGGHPLFLADLVKYAVIVGGATTGVVRLSEALMGRIERLDPPSSRLLEVLAVAGEPLPFSVVEMAACLTGAEATSAAAVLRVGMLARTFGARASDAIDTYHDRVRETVMAHLSADLRATLHGRIADALEAAEPTAEDLNLLVRHLVGAGANAKAAVLAERAAILAVSALAFDRAAELYSTALTLGAHPPADRRRLLVGQGHALLNAGRCAEAARVFLGATEGASAAENLEYRRLAGEQLLMGGDIEGGLREMRAVLREVGLAIPSSPRKALLSLLWHRARLRIRGLAWVERDPSQISGEDLQRLEIHKSMALGLAVADTVHGAEFQARSLLLALKTGERIHVARSLGLEASYRAAEGISQQAACDRLLAEVARMAKETDNPLVSTWLLGARGAVAYLMGDFSHAADYLGEAVQRFRQLATATTWEVKSSLFLKLVALLHLGRHRDLGRGFDEALADAARRGDRWLHTTVTRELNGVWLARDLPDRARRELDEATWSAPETGFLHVQAWYELHARGELELYVGRGATARTTLAAPLRAVSRSLLTRIQLIRAYARWLVARLALAEAEVATDPRPALRDAARMAGRMEHEGVPCIRAWASLIRAGIAAREGNPARAVTVLRQAITLCRQADLSLCAAVAERRLGELLLGDEGKALVLGANDWMIGETIRNPLRMSVVLAPGFPSA
jgi:hypothetical protein